MGREIAMGCGWRQLGRSGSGQPGQHLDLDGEGWSYGLADGDLLDVPKL